MAVADAPYLGSVLDDTTLIPSEQAWLGPTHFGEWLQRTVGAAARVG